MTMHVYMMIDDRRAVDQNRWPVIWLGLTSGHWTFAYLPASIVRVICLGYAVLGACLVSAGI